MTYVTEQTAAELRAHMRRLQKMPGWHNPLDDRLFAEVLALDAQVKALRKAAVAVPEAVAWSLRFPEDPRLNLSTVFDTKKEAEDWATKCGNSLDIVVPLYLAAPETKKE